MFPKLNKYLFFLILLFAGSAVPAQVLLNEVCPGNATVLPNTDGSYNDWIEIYNSGGAAVNLANYGLSDESTDPYKFRFPNYTLAAGARLVVFASDSNVSSIVNHWETAVTASTSWKYFVGNSQPDTNWRNLSFNDAAWASGPGGIGFGDGDDATIIPAAYSVMMRKSFFIPDTAEIIKAVFNMDYDDGFVAFLNGVEIARVNLGVPGDRPLYNVLANNSHEAIMYQGQSPDSFYIAPEFLKQIIVPGVNVLSVQVHNFSFSSNDLSAIPFLSFGMRSSGSTFGPTPSWFRASVREYFNAKFKLSRSGETVYLTNPAGVLVDQLSYSSMEIDNSYGRSTDGNVNWCYFGVPTPNNSNAGSLCYQGYASQPIFSNPAGFYPGSQWLTLSTTTPGGVVRYSSNGDDPTASSLAYSSPILINSSRIVRAKVFAAGYLPSPTVSNTFFINENINLPVFSISTDSLNLWDYNTGIYVAGPNADTVFPYKNANFWQDWRKPASIEYYDKDKNRLLRFNSEIGIYGNYSRAHPQKSIEISLSDRFGTGEISYPLIPDKSYIRNTDNIILRNSGTDWNVVHFRDAFMQRLMKNTYTGYLGTEPTVMFLNGKFWGVYTIHENHDHHWMKNNKGLGKKEMDYLKEYGSNIEVKLGSDTSFWSMYNYATSQNPAQNSFYDYMNSVLDLRNFADYFIAETFYDNGDWIGDWTNNIKLWKSHEAGAKWNYLLYDLDFGLGYDGLVFNNRLSQARNPVAFSHSSRIFNAMLSNPDFKRYFINRYADLMNTTYLYANMNAVMKQFRDSMSADMPRHFAFWGSNMTNWQNNINAMMNFANGRPGFVRQHIQSEFALSGQVSLTLNTSPAGSGRIEISTITPTSYPWTGIYFNGNPVTITAIPNPGYTFSHWLSNVMIPVNDPNQSKTINFTSADQITAYFTGSAAAPLITFSEINYNSSNTQDGGDWVELHNFGSADMNISGWKFRDEDEHHVFAIPTGTVIPAGGYLVLAENLQKFNSVYPAVSNVIGPLGFNLSNAGEQIRLFDYRDSLYLLVNYQDVAPWPLEADGQGYTCERNNFSNDPNDGNSWFAGCPGGSPGRAASSQLPIPVTVQGSTTFCAGGSASLQATSLNGYNYQWRLNAVDIPGATDSVYSATSSGQYSVRVSYLGCSTISDTLSLTSVTQTPDPTVPSVYRCGPGTLTLNASATDTTYWYDAPGGNLLGTGYSFTTPTQSTGVTYYVKSSLTCPSNTISVLADVLNIAAAPVVPDVNLCGPGQATLTATDTAMVRWYSHPIGGALLATGYTYVTPVLFGDTAYYAEAGSVCPSARVRGRVELDATPVPTTQGASRCGPGSLVLTASSPYTIRWFDAMIGGNQVGSGPNFTTPVLNSTTTYFAEARDGCPSIRIATEAIIDTVPAAPVANDEYSCGPGSVTLLASSSYTVYWYNAATGGTLLGTGQLYTTPVLNTTTSYYVEAGNDCRSPRTHVQVDILSPGQINSVGNASRCGPGSVVLTASSADPITWYDQASGGNTLGTGPSFTTPTINSSTTYYAVANPLCPGNPVAVTATVLPGPIIFLGNDTMIASGSSLVLDAGPGYATYAWSTGASTQTITVNSTGTYSVLALDNNGCTATDEIHVTVIVGLQSVFSETGIKVFPNPANHYIVVERNRTTAEKLLMEIRDVQGRLVLSDEMVCPAGLYREEINISQLNAGHYVLTLKTTERQEHLKLIKE